MNWKVKNHLKFKWMQIIVLWLRKSSINRNMNNSIKKYQIKLKNNIIYKVRKKLRKKKKYSKNRTKKIIIKCIQNKSINSKNF